MFSVLWDIRGGVGSEGPGLTCFSPRDGHPDHGFSLGWLARRGGLTSSFLSFESVTNSVFCKACCVEQAGSGASPGVRAQACASQGWGRGASGGSSWRGAPAIGPGVKYPPHRCAGNLTNEGRKQLLGSGSGTPTAGEGGRRVQPGLGPGQTPTQHLLWARWTGPRLPGGPRLQGCAPGHGSASVRGLSTAASSSDQAPHPGWLSPGCADLDLLYES